MGWPEQPAAESVFASGPSAQSISPDLRLTAPWVLAFISRQLGSGMQYEDWRLTLSPRPTSAFPLQISSSQCPLKNPEPRIAPVHVLLLPEGHILGPMESLFGTHGCPGHGADGGQDGLVPMVSFQDFAITQSSLTF